MPGSYLSPLSSALVIALLGFPQHLAHGQSPPIPRPTGHWWPRNNDEERRFLYAYPNVYNTLTTALDNIGKIRIGHPDSEMLTAYADGQRIIIRFLTAYRSLKTYAATHTKAQLNQKTTTPAGTTHIDARSVRRLLQRTETFLRQNKIPQEEIDAIAQSPNTVKVSPATLTKIFYPAEVPP